MVHANDPIVKRWEPIQRMQGRGIAKRPGNRWFAKSGSTLIKSDKKIKIDVVFEGIMSYIKALKFRQIMGFGDPTQNPRTDTQAGYLNSNLRRPNG